MVECFEVKSSPRNENRKMSTRCFAAWIAVILMTGSAWAASSVQVQPVPGMVTQRVDHTATLLPDGRVLLTGGTGAEGVLSSAEVYRPDQKAFEAVGSMGSARTGQTATLLSDGRVLIAGGWAAEHALASVEIFDAATNSFRSLAASLTAARSCHTATLLDSGQVLIAGGDQAGA